MYIVIAGGGLIGKGLAKALVAQKHDVVVIDKDQKVCEEVYSQYGTVTIQGSATALETLESARLDQCDIAVAVMKNDADNLSFSLLARHFGVKQIHARMYNPKYEEIYKSAGVSNIARVTDLLIDQLMVSIESPDIRKVISLGELEICIINIEKESRFSDITIEKLVQISGFPKEITIPCIVKGMDNSFQVAHGSTLVQSGDRVFVCGLRQDIKQVVLAIQNVS